MLIRLLGILLFIYILTTVDLDILWSQIRKVDSSYLFLGILFQVLLLFFKGIRWHLLNQGNLSRKGMNQSLGEFFESYAIGVITPGRMGELVKAGHAREKNRIMETGIRVGVERGFDMGIFVVLAGISLFFTFNDRAADTIGILLMLAGFAVIVLAMIFLRSPGATVIVGKLLNRIPFLKKDFMLSFQKRSNSVQLLVILLSLASNFSYFISCYMLALGLSFEQGFLFISGAVAIAGLLNMLPVTVMGLGTREGTFLLLFKPMAEPLILAFSGLVFLVAQIGGGLISLLLGQLFLALSQRNISRQK